MSKHGEVTDFQEFKIPGVTVTAMWHLDGRKWNHLDSPPRLLSTLMLQDSGCITHVQLHLSNKFINRKLVAQKVWRT